MKKQATKTERDHMSAVASLGCIPCRALGHEDTPAAIHHAKRSCGDGRCHMRVIGMCPDHHQHGKVSRHGTPKEFAKEFGTDFQLLDIVDKLLGK